MAFHKKTKSPFSLCATQNQGIDNKLLETLLQDFEGKSINKDTLKNLINKYEALKIGNSHNSKSCRFTPFLITPVLAKRCTIHINTLARKGKTTIAKSSKMKFRYGRGK